MSLSAKEIKQILEILEASGWDEATVTMGDVTVTVSKGGGAAVPPPASPPPTRTAGGPPAAPTGGPLPATAPTAGAPVGAGAVAAAPPPAVATGHTIASSTVGVFWRAPQPGAAPFVEVAAAVAAGQQLGIVEVMKLMTPVHADVAGLVAAIHVANGERVECGTPLVTIEPA